MAAVAERAIGGEIARSGRKDLENFCDHDWSVRADGRFAGGDDFGDCLGIAAEFFVFVFETARVFTGITLAALVRYRIGRGGVSHPGSFSQTPRPREQVSASSGERWIILREWNRFPVDGHTRQ